MSKTDDTRTRAIRPDKLPSSPLFIILARNKYYSEVNFPMEAFEFTDTN
jgi:hypothetical protein